MYTSVQYPDTIEPQVQFVEETAPEDIVEKTIEKLHAGVSIKEMCTASALAVVRSSEMPFFVNGQWGHHGGHMHPVSGIHAVKEIASRLAGDNRFLPVVQNVALANKHIHHPSMGPYLLPAFEPLDAGGVEGTKQAFFDAVRRGSVNDADHLLSLARSKRTARRSVRYAADGCHPKESEWMTISSSIRSILGGYSNGSTGNTFRCSPADLSAISRSRLQPKPVQEIAELIEKYQLLSTPLRQTTGADETEAIVQLHTELNDCAFADIS